MNLRIAPLLATLLVAAAFTSVFTPGVGAQPACTDPDPTTCVNPEGTCDGEPGLVVVDENNGICFGYPPQMQDVIEAVEDACPDPTAADACAEDALDSTCPLPGGTFPDCHGVAPAPDGFVAGYVIPGLREDADDVNPVGLGPHIVFQGWDLEVIVTAVERDGDAYVPYASKQLFLFVQVDCGPLTAALGDVISCQGPGEFIATIPGQTDDLGVVSYKVPRSDIVTKLFVDGPATGVHFFVATPDNPATPEVGNDAQYSDYFSPKEALMRAERFEAADQIDHQSFTPIVVMDGTAAIEPTTITATATDATAREGQTLDSAKLTLGVTGTARMIPSDIEGNENPLGSQEFLVRFTLGGTATYGADANAGDYHIQAPGLTQAAGTFSVPVPPDAAAVDLLIIPHVDSADGAGGALLDETVELTVQASEDYIVDQGLASATIQDFTLPVVTIDQAGAADTLQECTTSSTEDCDPPSTVAFTVARTLNTAEPLTVLLDYASGTGFAGVGDVDSIGNGGVPAQVAFAGGEASRTITLRAQDDTDVEGIEVLGISLAPSSLYDVDAAHDGVVFTVLDNELPVVTAAVGNLQVAEASGTSTFTLSRGVADPDGALAVKFRLSGSATRGATADSGDYHLTPALSPDAGVFTATIPAGQSSVTISVTSHSDTTKEGTEQVILTLEPASAYQVGSQAVGIGILDDDLPLVTVTAPDNTANEDAATATGQFRLARVPAADGLLPALTVNVTLTGTATATGTAADYTAKNGTTSITTQVTFPAGKRQVNVTISATNDQEVEAVESVVLTIQPAPSGAGLLWGVGSPSQASVNLVSDDSFSPAQDSDQDGVPDFKVGSAGPDNCKTVPNEEQDNADGDALGDACDTDDDNDGLTDEREGQLGTEPLVRDTDLDGRADGQEVSDQTDPKNLLSPSFLATAVRASTTGHGINVTWEAPSGSLADRYLVFMASEHHKLLDVVGGTTGRVTYLYNDDEFPGGSHEYFVQAMLPSMSGTAFNETLASTSSQAHVDLTACQAMKKDSDLDTVCDAQEAIDKTDPLSQDTDADGLDDANDPEPLVPRTTAGGEVSLTRELPFWIGLLLLVATLVGLFVGIGLRRRSAEETVPLAALGEDATQAEPAVTSNESGESTQQ